MAAPPRPSFYTTNSQRPGVAQALREEAARLVGLGLYVAYWPQVPGTRSQDLIPVSSLTLDGERIIIASQEGEQAMEPYGGIVMYPYGGGQPEGLLIVSAYRQPDRLSAFIHRIDLMPRRAARSWSREIQAVRDRIEPLLRR